MMFEGTYTQTLQDQIGQLSKLLGGQTASLPQPDSKAAAPANAFDYVAGLEGARAYLQKMLAGTKHIVWDNEQAIFYVLQKDANGNPARIQICPFTVEQEPTMEDRFVTKDDFNALVLELRQFMSAQKEVKDNG